MAIQHGIVEKVEGDFGKLFIGGISWDTDEARLKEYFSSYGEVVEAVIMRDRITGRARGFGFVVFVDPAVAEKVVLDKHMIDGRTVEAKKAVPREDHNGLNRVNGSIQGSPGPGGRTKKIFVGGLASTVTESDFKKYFDQFGGITDVVVMYDHNTQRPRGFGFITFDSEEAVDRVLHKTFHELNGKMVEVKRAVPKELSPGPNRSPLVGFNYGLTRPNTLFTSTYPQGFNIGSIGGYGGRANSQFSPIGRNGFNPFGSSGYGMGMNLEPTLSPGAFGGSSNHMGYGRVMSPYVGGNSNRYITPIGYNQSNGRNESFIGSSTRNMWGNGGLTSPNGSGAYLGSGSGGFGVFGNGGNWGSSPISTQNGVNSSGYNGGSIGPIGGPESNYGLGLGRNGPNVGQEGSYGNMYRGGSMYGDPTWQSSSNELDGPGSGSFGYGLDSSEDVGNYSIANRQTNRGIAA
ncbi:nucleotide-binding alpha-beta plait domain-containing protein [Artemisia annua]|uniref:Nucleotide-binding alpha-beta plait domain-containing protein n=1 Tax=Artemisia annua TaxID=35608 RepID=A0A2U1PH62_ARTAN|nr:nucleotide-binding alpha-beta plait domain-containing protein [Artemisia annua]